MLERVGSFKQLKQIARRWIKDAGYYRNRGSFTDKEMEELEGWFK